MRQERGEERREHVASRRGFLRIAGIGTVAGAAGAVAGGVVAPAQARETGPGRVGYRETEHVRRYYDLARF